MFPLLPKEFRFDFIPSARLKSLSSITYKDLSNYKIGMQRSLQVLQVAVPSWHLTESFLSPGQAWLLRTTCVRSVPMLPAPAASEKEEKLMQDMSSWEVSAFLWQDHVLSPINIPGLHLPLQPNWSWQLMGTSLQFCSTWIRGHYQSSSASKEAITPLRGAGTTEVVWYWNRNALCLISHYFPQIWTNWVKLSIPSSLFNS